MAPHDIHLAGILRTCVSVCIWVFPMYAKQMLKNQPLPEKLAVPPRNPKTQNPDSKTKNRKQKTHPKNQHP